MDAVLAVWQHRPISETTSKTARADRVLLALCVAGAFVLRVVPFAGRVLGPQWVLPAGDADLYYHVRRIDLATRAWPSVPDFDAWMNFPDGGFAPWPPLFDLVVATLARVTGIESIRVAVFFPAVLGALSVVPFWALLRPRCGRAPTWLATLLFAALPANVVVGTLGHIDHHVAEVLLQLWVYAWFARTLRASEAGRLVGWRGGLGFGVLMGVTMLTWAAGMVYLWIVAAVSCVWIVCAPDLERGVRMAKHVATGFATAALVIVPFALWNVTRKRSPFSSYHLSLLTLALCLAAGAGVVACAWISVAWRAGQRPRAARRLGTVLALVATPLLVPQLRAGFLQGLGFIARTSGTFSATVSETQPLLSSALTRGVAAQHVGVGHLLLPPLCLWLLARCWKDRGRDTALLLFAFWSLNVTVLSFAQTRFLYCAAPLVAAAPALGFALVRGSRWTARLLCAACLAAPWPALAFYWAPWFQHAQVPLARVDLSTLEFLDEVERVTPPSGDPRDPAQPPAYGIFAPWDLGHFVLVISQRAVVANNFGDNMEGGAFALAHQFYAAVRSEQEAVRTLERRRCPYLITTSRASFAGRLAGPEMPIATLLHVGNGTDLPDHAGSGRFRLLAASRAKDGRGAGEKKLFQLVSGARLTVSEAAPDDTLRVITRVQLGAEAFDYVRRLHAIGATATTRLGYPGEYRLLSGARQVGRFVVPAEAVARGTTLHLARDAAETPPSVPP